MMTGCTELIVHCFSHDYIHRKKSHYPPANHHASHLKNVLSPGPNHLLTTVADDPTLCLSPKHRWLGPGNRTFLEVDSIVVSWWIVAFCTGSTFQYVNVFAQNDPIH